MSRSICAWCGNEGCGICIRHLAAIVREARQFANEVLACVPPESLSLIPNGEHGPRMSLGDTATFLAQVSGGLDDDAKCFRCGQITSIDGHADDCGLGRSVQEFINTDHGSEAKP